MAGATYELFDLVEPDLMVINMTDVGGITEAYLGGPGYRDSLGYQCQNGRIVMRENNNRRTNELRQVLEE
jgi:hypothetical protein